MRRKTILLLAAFLAAAVLPSCRRRALTDGDNNVYVNIEINDRIVNYVMPGPPELMRAAFFGNENGQFAAHSFLPHTGGYANVIPGRTYNVMVYNFDTESTVISGEYDYGNHYACTNPVSKAHLSKLKSRSTRNDGETIVFGPDHLFVGTLEDVYIPARGADSPPVVLDVRAETVVQSWKIEVDKVQGVEWVAGIAGVITGQSHGNTLATRQKSDSPVSVYFESVSLEDDGHLDAEFNTFGYIPSVPQVISLVITDIAGQGHEFNIDVSRQFIDNSEQIIRIVTDQIVIDEPDDISSGGGGLQPDVDEWENIETDIII